MHTQYSYITPVALVYRHDADTASLSKSCVSPVVHSADPVQPGDLCIYSQHRPQCIQVPNYTEIPTDLKTYGAPLNTLLSHSIDHTCSLTLTLTLSVSAY